MSRCSNDIIFWNCNTLLRKFPQVQLLSQTLSPKLFAFCETKLNPHDPLPFLPHYICISKPFVSEHNNQGGIVVFVHESVPFAEIDNELSASPHCLLLRCRIFADSDCVVAVGYRQHALGADGWKALATSLRSTTTLGLPVLWLGDWNARHADWGDPSTCTYGRGLAQLTDSLQLSVLNTLCCFGKPTHGNSVIDLAITDRPTAFAGLLIDSTLDLVSDHLPLRLILKPAHSQPFLDLPQKRSRWVFRDADWKHYAAIADSNCAVAAPRMSLILDNKDTSLQSRVDDAAAEFCALLNLAAARAVPRSV
jgi:hypothetical protein